MKKDRRDVIIALRVTKEQHKQLKEIKKHFKKLTMSKLCAALLDRNSADGAILYLEQNGVLNIKK